MLPYEASGTDLPPYLQTSPGSHRGLFVLANRDHSPGNVTVTSFPGLPTALGLVPAAIVSVVEVLTGRVVLATVQVDRLAADGFVGYVGTGDATVYLIAQPSGVGADV